MLSVFEIDESISLLVSYFHTDHVIHRNLYDTHMALSKSTSGDALMPEAANLLT
jgi:hypothetical protein